MAGHIAKELTPHDLRADKDYPDWRAWAAQMELECGRDWLEDYVQRMVALFEEAERWAQIAAAVKAMAIRDHLSKQ